MNKRPSPSRAPAGDGRHVTIIVQNMPVPLDRRVWLECQTLVEDGYRVSVVCPKGPGDPSFEVIDDVRLHKYTPAPAAEGVAGYAVEFAWSWIRAALLVLRIHRRDRIAVLQACNPPDTYWLLARMLKRSGTRFLFDHHDLCPELYRSRGGSPNRWVQRALAWLERGTFRTADAVTSTNESYRRLACDRTGRPASEVTVVRSGPDPQRMRRGAANPALLAGHDHLVAYLGIMGPQDGVDVVVRVAHHIVHQQGRKDIRFALLGYGDCLDSLRELAVELDVADHVHFTGRADLQAIGVWLSTADVGISPDPYTPFNDVSTMNKTLEYMAYELPVVAFELTETVVSAGAAATYVTPSNDPAADVAAMADAVTALVDDPSRRREMGRIGRARIVDELGWPTSAIRYRDVVRRLTGRPVLAFSSDRAPAGALTGPDENTTNETEDLREVSR